MSRPSRRLVLAVLLGAPAGCSLLPAAGAPPKLYMLTAVSDFPAALPQVSWQLLVDTPAATAALDSPRMALSSSPTSIDYFADVAWTDRAPLLIQSLLVQSFENSGRITAIARESLALRADYILKPELRHFEAQYGAGADSPQALVEFNIKLIKMPDRAIIAQRTVKASAPAAKNQVPEIVVAFNEALHAAMRETVAWTLGGAKIAVR